MTARTPKTTSNEKTEFATHNENGFFVMCDGFARDGFTESHVLMSA